MRLMLIVVLCIVMLNLACGPKPVQDVEVSVRSVPITKVYVAKHEIEQVPISPCDTVEPADSLFFMNRMGELRFNCLDFMDQDKDTNYTELHLKTPDSIEQMVAVLKSRTCLDLYNLDGQNTVGQRWRDIHQAREFEEWNHRQALVIVRWDDFEDATISFNERVIIYFDPLSPVLSGQQVLAGEGQLITRRAVGANHPIWFLSAGPIGGPEDQRRLYGITPQTRISVASHRAILYQGAWSEADETQLEQIQEVSGYVIYKSNNGRLDWLMIFE